MLNNFITDLTGTVPFDCWRVNFSHFCCVYSTTEWRNEHQELYQKVREWTDRHLLTPELKELYNACERKNNARHQKTKRMYRFVDDAIWTRDCIFVTLTFSNETLDRTDETTRRKRVNEFLRPYSCYCFNLDYGKQNEREHYHALVVGSKSIDPTPWHKYGAVHLERVRNVKNANRKIPKYMTKLCEHATKGTCTGRITYSKVRPYEMPYSDWFLNSIAKDDFPDCPF